MLLLLLLLGGMDGAVRIAEQLMTGARRSLRPWTLSPCCPRPQRLA
jgi:hypothetical protein